MNFVLRKRLYVINVLLPSTGKTSDVLAVGVTKHRYSIT